MAATGQSAKTWGLNSAVFNVVKQYVTGRGTADADKYFYNNSKACYKWIDRT